MKIRFYKWLGKIWCKTVFDEILRMDPFSAENKILQRDVLLGHQSPGLPLI